MHSVLNNFIILTSEVGHASLEATKSVSAPNVAKTVPSMSSSSMMKAKRSSSAVMMLSTAMESSSGMAPKRGVLRWNSALRPLRFNTLSKILVTSVSMATTPPLWVTIYSKTSTITALMIITKRALFFMPAKFHMKERWICAFQYFDLAQVKYWPLKPQEHCF